MKFEIKSYWTGKVLFSMETESMKLCVEAAVESGADLRRADLRGADLRGADLRGADLRGADLRGADLRRADLRDADLRRADLRDADLSDADLSDADLSDADLSDADLSGVPKVTNLDAKILKAIEQGGTLKMDVWHTCETTHCRAGWAITLAGKKGKELESRIGSAAAGTLIYLKSTGRVPNFYASTTAALEDIKACAAKQA